MPATESPPPITDEARATRSGRLLALIRKLIDYGRELGATVRQRVAADPIFAKASFGASDLAVIVARIARGMRLAQALEARVLSRSAALDKGKSPRRARSDPRHRPPASPPTRDADPRLARLPTAEQIAAEVRRRPIGAVIADICRDLGILPSHPLWREVQRATLEYGGSLARLLRDIHDRAFPLPSRRRSANGAAGSTGPALLPEMPACTGPP